jgi:hypothetical protein
LGSIASSIKRRAEAGAGIIVQEKEIKVAHASFDLPHSAGFVAQAKKETALTEISEPLLTNDSKQCLILVPRCR